MEKENVPMEKSSDSEELPTEARGTEQDERTKNLLQIRDEQNRQIKDLEAKIAAQAKETAELERENEIERKACKELKKELKKIHIDLVRQIIAIAIAMRQLTKGALSYN